LEEAMRTRTTVGYALGCAAAFAAWGGCSSSEPFAPVDIGDAGLPPSEGGTPACGIVSTAVHGLTTDGRVDISAAEAWPSRPAEPRAITPAETLGACAILSACFSHLGDAGATDADQIKGIASCVDPAMRMWEERAVPELNENERWSFKVRTILEKKACGGVLAVSTRPAGVTCQEDGCYWSDPGPPPTVTCEGDVATLSTAHGTFTRDCSHAYTACSTESGTGCTDRPRVACDSRGNDRCDGDVKLGCDRCGLVSFHDCALLGGHCVENPSGAACVYPDPAGCTAAPSCAGNVLTFCVAGAPTTVDCVALGLDGCANGHCVK
jgi:hypothetical protein